MKSIRLNDTNIKEIKDIFQDCNINFLIGSGLSSGYLSTLNTIEKDITSASKIEDSGKREVELKKHYLKYFNDVISKNLNILKQKKPYSSKDPIRKVVSEYKALFDGVRKLLFFRKSTILNKQANIFTTNIDIFMEISLDEIGAEYNDGFVGKYNQFFSSSNFKKTYHQKSQHYNNESEIPSFNLIKLHGSLTWKYSEGEKISFSGNLEKIRRINKCIEEKEDFMPHYEQLCIVNPSKEKFKDTLLNQNYYDLLRIYSNELEKENSVLFCMGFSFEDEHVREVTIRVANSNPTLIIYIFAYDGNAVSSYENLFFLENIKNNNIFIIAPEINADDKTEIPNTFEQINKKFIVPLVGKSQLGDAHG